jgi:enoyl-CoA hydratase
MSVVTSIAGGVARLSIDDGKVNAMSRDLLCAISEGMTAARDAGAIVVMTGRPGIFSAGFDMGTFAKGADATRAMVGAGIEVILDILRHPRPVITCAGGHAFPMGAFLMLAADVRLGVSGDFRIGMNETAIQIDVPDFALALAKSRLSPSAYASIRVARMYAPSEAVAAGYLDFAGSQGEIAVRLDEEVKAALALDAKSFASTKLRMNEVIVSAILDAGVPSHLKA